MKLTNKNIIVTGASSGIGAALVKALAGRGANVLMTARSEEPMRALQTDLADLPGDRHVFAADLADMDNPARVIEAATGRFDRIDALVNNAGINLYAALDRISEQDLDRILDVNLRAVLRLNRLVIPIMKAQSGAPRGQIVDVASVIGHRGVPQYTVYSATKFGLRGLDESLRVELRPWDIDVITINPGRTDTPFFDNSNCENQDPPSNSRRMPAETAAEIICRAMERRKREVNLTIEGKLLIFLNRYFPRLLDSIMTKRQ